MHAGYDMRAWLDSCADEQLQSLLETCPDLR